MAVIGTFGSFTTARLGIYASQAALNVTGNNIANVNTEGYTRQRLDLRSLHGSGRDVYLSTYGINLGHGVLVDNVNQIRDPYLDIRYRAEQAKLGSSEAKLDGYSQLASVLDEVGKGNDEFGMVEDQLNEIIDSLQKLTIYAGSKDIDSVVRSSASSLAKLLNDYSSKMYQVEENVQTTLNAEVEEVNTLLVKIRGLNESIRQASLYGDNALELRDERNLLIDDLSKKIAIDVTYSNEVIDQYTSVEKLTIAINPGQGKDPILLVDGIYSGSICFVDKDSDRYELQVNALQNKKGHYKREAGIEQKEPTLLEDNDLSGKIQALRELLTEKGEFSTEEDMALDSGAVNKRGIPYYIKSLDALAEKIAAVFNESNSGVLFSNNGNGDDTDGITASNISVSKSWQDGSVRIDNTKVPTESPDGEHDINHSTQTDSIIHMINRLKGKEDFTDENGNVYFNGTLREYFTRTCNTLASDTKTETLLYQNYNISSLDLENNRSSVSGVDLNEEATSMMQYQRSYQAACQLLRTLDSMLDKLINGTLN